MKISDGHPCHLYIGRTPGLIVTSSKSFAAPIYYNKKNKKTNYVSLPDDVKFVHKQSKASFDSLKNNGFSTAGDLHKVYRSKHRDYRQSLLRVFLL